MTPEGRVKRDIRNYLAQRFGSRMYVFAPVQMGYGEATVDLLCCLDGLFLAFEVKRPGKLGATTARQRTILGAIHAATGRACIVHSLDEVKEALQTWGWYVP